MDDNILKQQKRSLDTSKGTDCYAENNAENEMYVCNVFDILLCFIIILNIYVESD